MAKEEEDAVALADYLSILQNQGKVHVYSHIPHETFTRSWMVKVKNKRQGVRPGVPDYIIVVNGKVLFLELKRRQGGHVSDEQKVWIAALEGKTTFSQVCKGFDAAKAFIDFHLLM